MFSADYIWMAVLCVDPFIVTEITTCGGVCRGIKVEYTLTFISKTMLLSQALPHENRRDKVYKHVMS